MERATFCICVRGFSSWSPRLYDAITSGCIPVIFSDGIILPFENLGVDWSKFSVRIREEDVLSVKAILKSYSAERIREMRRQLSMVRTLCLYSEAMPEKKLSFDLDPAEMRASLFEDFGGQFRGYSAMDFILEDLTRRKPQRYRDYQGSYRWIDRGKDFNKTNK